MSKSREQFCHLNRVHLHIYRDSHQRCVAKEIRINGVSLRPYQLGRMVDIDTANAPPQGCGNRVFIPNKSFIYSKSTKEMLGFNDEDAKDLETLLIEVMSIGRCQQCR